MKTNWPTKKLGEMGKIRGGNAAPQDKSAFSSGSTPFVRMQDLGRYHITTKLIETVDKVNNDAIKKFNLKIWPKGSILIPRSGSVYMNHRAILGADACVVSHIAILTDFNKKILPKYFFYYLTIFNIGKLGSRTTGIDSISFGQIKRIKIPLPSISTQKKIVKRLNTIRKAQELNEKQISLAEKLFQSLLHRELKPKSDWMLRRLGEACEVNPRTNLDLSKDKLGYVEMAAIDENLKEIKYFLDRSIDKVSSGAPKFRNGDVIFARITPCTENGKVAFVEDCHEVCAGSTELHVLRAKQNEVLPRFIFYFLIKPRVKDMAVASMTGTTGRQRVPAEFFRYLKILLPPLKSQQQIVEKLSTVQEYKKKLLRQKELLQELFESTLAKAMKGELVK